MRAGLTRRLATLESVTSFVSGTWHRILWRHCDGQTEEEGFEEYGRDKIKTDDHVIVRKII